MTWPRFDSLVRIVALPMLAGLVGCAELGHSVLGLSRTATGSSDRFRTGLAYTGVPGLIDVPVADALLDGQTALSAHTKLDSEGQSRLGDTQRSASLAFGFTPFLTFAGRAVLAEKVDTNPRRDVSPNAHLLLLDEGAYWPALAVGATDFAGGATHYETEYLVLSRTWFDLGRTTVGYRRGSRVASGVMLGLEISPVSYFSLLAEYDGSDAGVGLRLFPIPAFLERYGVPRASLEGAWTEESGFAAQLALQYTLGEAKFEAQRADRASVKFTPAQDLDERAAIEALRTALVERGFQSVELSSTRTSSNSFRASIRAENRRFGRDPLHGLGVILGLAATHLPESASAVSLRVVRFGLEVIALETGRDALVDFLNDDLPIEVFADQLIEPIEGSPSYVTERSAGPAFEVDLTAVPRLEGLVLSESDVVDYRFTLFPDLKVQLWPGLLVNAQVELEVANTTVYFGPPIAPNLSRLLATQTVRLPTGDALPSYAGVSLGKFEREVFGAGAEVMISTFDGRVRLRGAATRIGEAPEKLDRWYAVASARVAWPEVDAAVEVRGGKFLDGDVGARFELARTFGTTELGAFMLSGDHGTVAGLALRIPLSLPEDLPPFWLRPRLPDVARFGIHSLVFEETNDIRLDVGRPLAPELEIPELLLGRERLTPAFVRAHLDEVRDSARFFVGSNSQ